MITGHGCFENSFPTKPRADRVCEQIARGTQVLSWKKSKRETQRVKTFWFGDLC